MRGYLANASCNGRRPKKVGTQRLYSRPRLVKSLVCERLVARFIIAPSGFGKTSLALEYAGSIFSFLGVHWLDCQSPCFLRDLDSSSIAETLLASPDGANLVVFDDVPYLDDVRLDCFSKSIDSLMDAGCEVLAITTPAFASIAHVQRDCVVVNACDLLIDDSEVSASHLAAFGPLRQCDRVPAFLWGGEAGMSMFLKGMRLGEMPAEVRGTVFSMAALRTGTFDELSAISAGMRDDACCFIASNYPYLGINVADETFEAHGFDIHQIVRGMGETADSNTAALLPSRDELSPKVACLLASRGEYERACSVVRQTCSRKRRIAWLAQQQWNLIDAGCLEASQEIFEGFGERHSGIDASMMAAACLRLAMLDDYGSACQIALRVLGMASASASESFLCALVALASRDAAFHDRAIQAIEMSSLLDCGDAAQAQCARKLGRSAVLFAQGDLRAACAQFEGIEPASALFRATCAYAVLLLRSLPQSPLPDYASGLVKTAASMNDALSARCGAPCVFEAALSSALARCGALLAEDGERSEAIDEMVVSLAAQRERRRLKKPGKSAQAGVPTISRAAVVVPEMRVSIFGGMEVSIGGDALDPNGFSKQSTKTLLAVLVLFKGKEVPRAELFRILWPNASEQRATSNFYSLWCKLRQALGASKKQECPYLVRHKASVMINPHYVRSDVEEFESLCRTLMFDDPNARAWLAIFERMEEAFSCDLLPSETENSYIAAMRRKYRSRRVDAYVAAAMRLVDAGESAAALWFANAALESEPSREDAYFALMRAQSGSGQRTQAMETYRSCGSYLSQNLGIDVSGRMSDLYAELLEGAV